MKGAFVSIRRPSGSSRDRRPSGHTERGAAGQKTGVGRARLRVRTGSRASFLFACSGRRPEGLRPCHHPPVIATGRDSRFGWAPALCLALVSACRVDGSSAPQPGEAGLPAPLFADREGRNCGSAQQIGKTIEDFELPALEGQALRLSEFRGRVVLLNFWGTWCQPCLEELPEFSALYRSYRDAGMSLIAVSTDADADAVRQVAEHHQLTAHFALDGEALAERQGDHDFPFTYLLDESGTVRASWDGYDAACLGHVEDEVRKLLAND